MRTSLFKHPSPWAETTRIAHAVRAGGFDGMVFSTPAAAASRPSSSSAGWSTTS
ncbi:hypothetical protein [Pseudonocardia sp. N23]|uniref:hypothetical protein n=1 Tax=Pseudonocardia sp. N23 TaxID=1987376 RepID=UPI000C023CEF|nr:hypothetical protein [Pseudonocardia sp. N23]GAY11861.1 hypothetical protein TOK_0246 [Pseudonocardia sp. N23]